MKNILLFMFLTIVKINFSQDKISENNTLILKDFSNCFKTDTGFIRLANDFLTNKGYNFDPNYQAGDNSKMYNLWVNSIEGVVTSITIHKLNKEMYFFLYFFHPEKDPNFQNLMASIKTNAKLKQKKFKNHISTYDIYLNSDSSWYALDTSNKVVWIMNNAKYKEFITPIVVYKEPPIVKPTINPKVADLKKTHFKFSFSTKSYENISLFASTIFEISEKNKGFDSTLAKYPWYSVQISDNKNNEYSVKLKGQVPNTQNEIEQKTIEILCYPVYEAPLNFILKMKKIADPCFNLNGTIYQSTCTITSAELLKAKQLIVQIPGDDYKYLNDYIKFPIVSYVFSTSDGEIQLSCDKAEFSNEIIEIITKAKPNDKFYFESIKIKAPDSTIRTLPNLVVTIK